MKVFRFPAARHLFLVGMLSLSAQSHAQTPSAGTNRPGTSDSGDIEQRLQVRIERALEKDASPPTLGSPSGYHWVFLMQSARYKDSNVRFTSMRRGVQRWLDTLAQSRRAWPAGSVRDTVSFVPYHFNILGDARGRQQPLAPSLADLSALKQRVPGEPLDDKYGDGQTYRDGHDWRLAMTQTLGWLAKNDIPLRHTIIVVIDWNDLAQAPQQLADGTARAGESKYLTLPQNAAPWAEYTAAMTRAGFAPRNLETVQAGNLEYDIAVFRRSDLAPLPAQNTTDKVIIEEPPLRGGGLVPVILLAALGGAALLALRPHRFQINGSPQELKFLGRNSLAICGANARGAAADGAVRLPPEDAPDAPDRALAYVKTDLLGKLSVANGAYQVRAANGFKATPTGALLTAPNGRVELRNGDDVVAHISIKKG